MRSTVFGRVLLRLPIVGLIRALASGSLAVALLAGSPGITTQPMSAAAEARQPAPQPGRLPLEQVPLVGVGVSEPPMPADVTVKVLRRAREDADRPSDQKNTATLMLIKLSLSAGTYSTELTGDSRPTVMERRSAARTLGTRS
jgi:hypothetical protein